MKRKEFLKKTMKYGAGMCLGMHLLSTNEAFAAIRARVSGTGSVSEDDFVKLFSWLKNALNADIKWVFKEGTTEHAILSEFKEGWVLKPSVELLTNLSEKYGDKAYQTIYKFMEACSVPYWKSEGEKKAKKGTEVEDFIEALYGSMNDDFEFKRNEENGISVFCVTKCPYADLAKNTELRKWVYVMACKSDYYMTPSFNKEVGFCRTKTKVQEDDSCNHTYYYKSKVKKEDSLLAYCGLYCGACPSYQNTQKVVPINYDKKNFYEACEGCNSDLNTSWCGPCEIKKCNKEKNIRVCIDCNDYPCKKITDFINDKKYPYHKEVEAKMKLYKEVGLEKWLAMQESEYHCPNCKTKYNFFETMCEECRGKL